MTDVVQVPDLPPHLKTVIEQSVPHEVYTDLLDFLIDSANECYLEGYRARTHEADIETDNAYSEGYESGYNSAQNYAHEMAQEQSSEAYADGYNEGYEAGYDAGTDIL